MNKQGILKYNGMDYPIGPENPDKVIRYGNCEISWSSTTKQYNVFYKDQWVYSCESQSKCRVWIRGERLRGQFEAY